MLNLHQLLLANNQINMYKVSVGIPVYNVAAYVERALLSALNQTLPDIEYIIVDDRGTDNSMDIVRRVLAEHPRGKDVRIIEHEVNKGCGAARDTMIANATAPYIYFLDGDDELTEDAITLLYNVMKQSNGTQVVRGNYETIPIGGHRSGCVDRSAGYHVEKKEGDQVASCWYPVVVWNRLYDLSFLKQEKISFGGLRHGEDVYFTIQIACKAWCVIYIPYVTYFYYEIASSLSAGGRERRFDEARCIGGKRLYGKLFDFGWTLEGKVRSFFECTMLEIFYCENRYVLRASGLTYGEKMKYLGELDELWHTYPFKGKYRSFKTKLFWMLYRMPKLLRICLIKSRNLF